MEEKYELVTFVFDRMKLSIEHRKSTGIEKKKIKDRTPRDTTVPTRSGGLTVQLCGDSNVACKWINGEFSLRPKYRGEIGLVQRTVHYAGVCVFTGFIESDLHLMIVCQKMSICVSIEYLTIDEVCMWN